jgi:hypothetical protein
MSIFMVTAAAGSTLSHTRKRLIKDRHSAILAADARLAKNKLVRIPQHQNVGVTIEHAWRWEQRYLQ